MKVLFTISLSLVFSLVLAGAAEKMPLSKKYWKDKEFLKDFNGSYRINAAIEPRLTGEVRAELVKVQNLMEKGKRKQAIESLSKSKFFKNSAAIRFNLANLLVEEGKLDDSIAEYKAAILLMPAFRRAHQNLAYAYVKKDDWTAAFPHLQQVVKLGGADGSVLGLLGYSYQEKGEYQAALQAFRTALMTQPAVIDWKLGVAHSLQQTGQTRQALQQYLEIVKVRDEPSYRLQTVSLYLELGETQKAIVLLDLLRRQNHLKQANLQLLGTLLLSEGNTKLGGEILRKTLTQSEALKPQLSMDAVRYCLDAGLGELAGELHALIKVEDTVNEEARRFTRLRAEILLLKPSTRDEAIEILNGLVKLDPLDSKALYLLAQQAVLNGSLQKALILFDQAIAAEGSHSEVALLEKAKVQVSLKLYDDAIKSLQIYLEQKKDPKVQEYLNQLKFLKKAAE